MICHSQLHQTWNEVASNLPSEGQIRLFLSGKRRRAVEMAKCEWSSSTMGSERSGWG